jgi:hypothetical protein
MVLFVLPQKRLRKVRLSGKTLNDETIESVTTFFQGLFEQKKLDGTIKRQEADQIRLQRSFADTSATSLTVGAAKAPGGRLLFATIDTDTLTSEEIAAVVVASMTITITTTVALPTRRRISTVATVRLAMGIALATISLKSGSPRLVARKTARVTSPRARCTATRVARRSTVGPNVPRTRPTRRSRQRSATKRTTHMTSCCPASNAASLSDHRTALASDKSSDKYEDSRSDYSDDEDNFAVAILAAPCKQAKPEVCEVPPKKELTIPMSESDDGTVDDAASAKLGKLAASYTAAPSVEKKRRCTKGPKGAQRDPLNLSDSN